MPSAPLPWSTSLRAPSTLAHLPGSPEEQAGWRLRQLTGCCWWGQWPFYRAALFEMSQFSLEQARLHLHLHLPGVYRVTSLPVHPGLRQRFSRRGGQQPRLQGPDTGRALFPSRMMSSMVHWRQAVWTWSWMQCAQGPQGTDVRESWNPIFRRDLKDYLVEGFLSRRVPAKVSPWCYYC